MGFIYFYINRNLAVMGRSITFLFAFVLISACNNDNKKNTQKESKTHKDDRDSGYNDGDDRMGNKNNDKKNSSSYNWPEREQNKFLEDCRRESEQKVIRGKLKDFCSCMLTQAQKYYPTYAQMDEKSDEDDDRKILESCLEYFGEDEK
jgi:hypothetical protein